MQPENLNSIGIGTLVCPVSQQQEMRCHHMLFPNLSAIFYCIFVHKGLCVWQSKDISDYKGEMQIFLALINAESVLCM